MTADQLKDLFEEIERRSGEALARLERLVHQPSVSAGGEGIEEMALIVAREIRALGGRVEVVRSGGFPVVVGRLPGRSSRRLLIYNHYDVQPPEPLEAWDQPPFEPTLREGRLWARGTADNKGDFAARLAAVEAWQRTRGNLPVEIVWVVEGEEEIGSPNLETFAERHADLLQAEGCLWEFGRRLSSGSLEITLGMKGMAYLELKAVGAAADQHSSLAPLVPNPAWRLVWALASLKDPGEEILLQGFRDGIASIPPVSTRLLEGMEQDDRRELARLGLDSFLLGASGEAALQRLHFEPTCNICGLTAGYQGPGPKTVLPAEASAKLDLRLLPGQDPRIVPELIRSHLARRGLGDIEVRMLAGEAAAMTEPTDPFVAAAENAARLVYAREPQVVPISPATGPIHALCHRYGTPAVSFGVGNPDSRIHAPNENIRVEDFVLGIKQVAALLSLLAEPAEPARSEGSPESNRCL
ncbi:MAG: M20/M25/M40 family metallo-hydrolase [Firmicutes bacterium]|nr:M20/M25/M40 family metallo-hydrolase [Bacillota bacterium]